MDPHPYDFLRSSILPLKLIDSLLPEKGKIIELGCGQGVICTYLARKPGRQLIGVDLRTSRLKETELTNIKFIKADIRDYDPSGASAIIISDVLHHIVPHDQKEILKNISLKLKKGNILIIKEIDSSQKVRSRLSRFWDFVFYPQDRIYYWSSQNLKKFLKTLGFQVKVVKASKLFPGSTNLFICAK